MGEKAQANRQGRAKAEHKPNGEVLLLKFFIISAYLRSSRNLALNPFVVRRLPFAGGGKGQIFVRQLNVYCFYYMFLFALPFPPLGIFIVTKGGKRMAGRRLFRLKLIIRLVGTMQTICQRQKVTTEQLNRNTATTSSMCTLQRYGELGWVWGQ